MQRSIGPSIKTHEAGRQRPPVPPDSALDVISGGASVNNVGRPTQQQPDYDCSALILKVGMSHGLQLVGTAAKFESFLWLNSWW